MMKNAVLQQRHNLKKKYFDPFPLHLVRRTSSVPCMSTEQWIELVEPWKSSKKMVYLFLKSKSLLVYAILFLPKNQTSIKWVIEQWIDSVFDVGDMSSEQKYKTNRGNVKFHQTNRWPIPVTPTPW